MPWRHQEHEPVYIAPHDPLELLGNYAVMLGGLVAVIREFGKIYKRLTRFSAPQ